MPKTKLQPGPNFVKEHEDHVTLDTDILDKRIKDLEEKNKVLEARLKALERSTSDADNNNWGHDGVWWP